MIIGTAISRLLEPPDKVLNFDVEELETPESDWYYELLNVKDSIGSVESLKNQRPEPSKSQVSKKRKVTKVTPNSKRSNVQESKIIAIEELPDDSDSDDGLAPYQKPDNDPEDSDDDPTLINRSKPIAPV